VNHRPAIRRLRVAQPGRRLAALLLSAVFLTSFGSSGSVAATNPYDRPEYLRIKKHLLQGWGTWNARNVLSQTLLPDCFSIYVGFKQLNWLGYDHLGEVLIARKGEDVEQVRPGLHALDGSYSELELHWRQMSFRVQTAAEGEDFVMLLTPQPPLKIPVYALLGAEMLWNRPGTVFREGDALVAKTPLHLIHVYAIGKELEDPYTESATPYLTLALDGPVAISGGRRRSLNEVESMLKGQREKMEDRAAEFGDLKETYLAVESGLAWNTIYEPKYDRMVSTVGRLWDEEYGGYALFGWDNFFLAYMTSLYSRDLSYANLLEHLRSMTPEGFVPNDDRGNGTKSWDHSQPPVGAILLREIYKRYPERWLLEACFDDLLAWNRWWVKARVNEELLSYGSDLSQNPFGQSDIHTRVTAGYESGMDDSPMYEGVPFNPGKNTLELQDVGLNSLYVADSKALAEMAVLLGRNSEAQELRSRAARISAKMNTLLWDAKDAAYLNRRTDSGMLSERVSPTIFYPLLARIPDDERARDIVRKHFFNPGEFYGDYMLPSIERNDPSFPQQRYWQGAVWPPLNFLVYLGLRNYSLKDAGQQLVTKSRSMFLSEWGRKGFVSENYSAITGTGDDPRLSSDEFHSWGALMGFLSFIEEGKMPAPEAALQ
jgi:putative isomerase